MASTTSACSTVLELCFLAGGGGCGRVFWRVAASKETELAVLARGGGGGGALLLRGGGGLLLRGEGGGGALLLPGGGGGGGRVFRRAPAKMGFATVSYLTNS